MYILVLFINLPNYIITYYLKKTEFIMNLNYLFII